MRQVFLLVMIFLFSFGARQAKASSQEAEEKYTSIESLLQTIEGVNASQKQEVPCPAKKEIPRIAIQKNIAEPQFQKIQAASGEEISVSILTEEEVQKIFKRLQQEKLGLKNRAVCAQRAQVMSFVMEQEGIRSGKLFAEPGWFRQIVPNYADNESGKLSWKFHVAPFVYVKKGDKIEEYVLDPGAFSKPVPRKEWEEFLSSHPKSGYSRSKVSSPYAYRVSDMYDKQQGFKSSELQQARQILDVANSRFFNPANY